MKSPHGPLLWFILIGLVVAAGLYLAPSEEAKITKRLEALADRSSYDAGHQKLPDPARLKPLFAEYLTDPITVYTAERGDSSYSLLELVEGFMAYTGPLSALHLHLDHIRVLVTPNADRATATGELLVTAKRSSGVQRSEPRLFVVTLEKRDKQWLVVHAQVNEPQFDQPEARP